MRARPTGIEAVILPGCVAVARAYTGPPGSVRSANHFGDLIGAPRLHLAATASFPVAVPVPPPVAAVNGNDEIGVGAGSATAAGAVIAGSAAAVTATVSRARRIMRLILGRESVIRTLDPTTTARQAFGSSRAIRQESLRATAQRLIADNGGCPRRQHRPDRGTPGDGCCRVPATLGKNDSQHGPCWTRPPR